LPILETLNTCGFFLQVWVRLFKCHKPKNTMPSKAPNITLEEIPGDQFRDLDAAQSAALSLISASLQALIRDLLERGALINANGKIIPNPKDKVT